MYDKYAKVSKNSIYEFGSFYIWRIDLKKTLTGGNYMEMGLDGRLAFLRSRLEDYEAYTGLTFKYQKQTDKAEISQALRLWKFILNFMEKDNLVVRREFLSEYIGNKNGFVAAVAAMECLPTSVWRKILWKHNIDFTSFESFLRRLTPKQFLAIHNNCQDLWNNDVPRVARGRSGKKIDVWTLKQEEINPEKRYMSKGSWSFNLLNLDFGFNAYPDGEDKDREIRGNSPMRFLSTKNHTDDFVVNQEDGRYWQLYRKARSNYAWFPNKKVELNTHICPGFWYTLIMHLWFWIISPVFFAGFIMAFPGLDLSDEGIVKMLALTPGILTPLWLLFAFSRFISRFIMDQLQSEKMRWLKSDWLENAIVLVAIISIVGVVTKLTYMITKLLVETFGISSVATLLLMAVPYISYKIISRERKGAFSKFHKFPIYFQAPIVVGVLITLYRFLDLYLDKIVYAIGTILSLIASYWLITIVFILPIALFLAMSWSDRLSEERQTKIDMYIERIAKYMFIIFAIALLGLISYPDMLSAITTDVYAANMIIIGLFMATALIATIWFLAYAMNPTKKEISGIMAELDEKTMAEHGSLLLENRWFISLTKREKEKHLLRVRNYVYDVFDGNDRNNAYKLLLSASDSAILDKLESCLSEISRLSMFWRPLILEKMIRNPELSVAEAHVLVKDGINKRSENEERIKMRLKEIFFIPIAIWKALAFVSGKIIEYVKTLRYLYELFNKKCPYISEQRPMHKEID